MKTWAAFAVLLVLSVVPANAQQPADEPDKRATLAGEIELLELRQDVDKTLLREAMLMLGRKGFRPTQELPDAKREKTDEENLKLFIDRAEHAFAQRSVELRRKKAELARVPSRTQAGQPGRRGEAAPDDEGKKKLIEQAEEAQIEVQLLQMQTQLYQQPLNDALQALANAEFAASNDKSQQEQADAARKRFDKARAKYVEFSKRLQFEQGKVGELQTRLGMGGMGGGFR